MRRPGPGISQGVRRPGDIPAPGHRYVAVQRLDPVGLLVGFGLFAWATALIYRRPVPVQPMKVVAALVIAGGLTATEVAATGILLGVILCVLRRAGRLAASGGLSRRPY